MFDKTFSILPPFVRGTLASDVIPQDAELVYSSYRKNTSVFGKIISLVAENFQIYRKIHRNSSIWYYNLCMLNVVLYLAIKWFKPSVKQNVIVLDFTPSTRRWTLLSLYKRLFNKANSTITLASYSGFTNKRTACIPGVIPQNVKDNPEITHTSNDFLISGALSENISLLKTLLIPAFAKMPTLRLHITGCVDNENELLQLINPYPNIVYHGQMPFSAYIQLLHSVPFVLSTRNPSAVENRCNFPSKILEALAHNRAIISTIDYPQLGAVKYFKVSSEIDKFISDILSIAEMDICDVIPYINQANVVSEMFSPQVWEQTMRRLENDEQ